MTSSQAGANTCESYLQQEFNRTPVDWKNGLVSDRVPINVESLMAAYRTGIFPWGSSEGRFARWHRPPERGVLEFDDLHIGRSDWKYLKRAFKDPELRVTFDRNFSQVVELCAAMPRSSESTWISPSFIKAYNDLHRAGMAHSVEVWRGSRLVGGLYGTFVDGVFTGESMFHLEPNVTKLAFYYLIQRLASQGHTFIDTQMAIGLAGKWGAKLIPRPQFEAMLQEGHRRNLRF